MDPEGFKGSIDPPPPIIAESTICKVNWVKHLSSERDRRTIDFQNKVSGSRCGVSWTSF